MNKKYFSALFCFLPCIAFAQADTLTENLGGGTVSFRAISNDTLMADGYRLGGMAHGVHKTYYANGLAETITTYAEGKKSGPAMKMTPEGQQEIIEHYHNDKLHGERRVFAKGHLVEVSWYVNGLLHGPYISYHADGSTAEKTTYQNGKINGLFETFYAGGKLKETVMYREGGRTGLYEQFSEKGNPLARINYKDGLREGYAEYYFSDGDKQSYGGYKDDKKSGFWKEYMHSGVREEAGKYVAGERHGEWVEYLNGIPERKYTYDAGKLISKN